MDIYFSALDELIQIIYQGSAKFVLMSRVNYASWTVHLGLSGVEGRWWRGKWADEDVEAITGSGPTEDMLEAFGERLAKTIVTTDLVIGNWNPEKGTKINLTLGLSSKKPMTMDLSELSPSDAAAFATKEFLSIALEAQSRKCRLNPPTFGLPPPEPSPRPTKVSAPNKDNGGNESSSEYSVKPVPMPVSGTRHGISESLKAKQDFSEQTLAKRPHASLSSEPGPVSKQPAKKNTPQPMARGLSIPNKRARKLKAMEFESDDE